MKGWCHVSLGESLLSCEVIGPQIFILESLLLITHAFILTEFKFSFEISCEIWSYNGEIL
jgi:hypothetical protein